MASLENVLLVNCILYGSKHGYLDFKKPEHEGILLQVFYPSLRQRYKNKHNEPTIISIRNFKAFPQCTQTGSASVDLLCPSAHLITQQTLLQPFLTRFNTP